MILVSASEFRMHLRKYLELAIKEPVLLKGSNGVIFEITPSKNVRFNPSPSNDPYFNDHRNIESIERGKAQAEAGQYTEYSSEELKRKLGL